MTATGRGKRLLWRVGVPGIALVGGLVGGLAIIHWGLVAPMFIVGPLALGFSALLAAIGASWIGTFAAPDATRSHLLRVVLFCEVTAAVVAAGFFAAMLLSSAFFRPLIYTLALSPAVIAAGACYTTWCFRGPRGHAGRRVAMLLPLAAVVLLLALAGLTGVSVLLPILFRVPESLFAIVGIAPAILAGLTTVIASAILLQRRYHDPEDLLERDAALTLGLVGLPAPVFFGVYYLAYVFNLTSG